MSAPDNVGEIAPVITRNGSLIAADLMNRLVSLRIERALNLVGRARLRFSDDSFTVSDGNQFDLGTKIAIGLPDQPLLFEGTVTGVELDHRPKYADLVVTIHDDGFKLSRGTVIHARLQTSYSNAMTEIAQAHGLRAAIDGTADTFEYLLQAGSDLIYVNTMAERCGYSWWVKMPAQAGQQQTLRAKKVVPGSPTEVLEFGEAVDELSIRASGLRPTDVVVNGWDAATQQAVVGSPENGSADSPVLLTKYVGKAPAAALTAAKASVASPASAQSDAKTTAAALYADWESAAVVASGRLVSVDPKFDLGDTIKITNAGNASGQYVVTELEHVYDASGFFTRFTSGPRRPAGLVDTLAGAAAVPDAGFSVTGLVVGIVTDNKDPDKIGRVKVKYPDVDESITSPWARVLTLGGGAARGVVFQPEVNDEVLVGFERGDTRRPVVLGGLFSKRNALPTGETVDDGGKVGYRRLTSRKNHIIEFGDGEGPTTQHILLKLGTAAHSLRLGADAFDIEVASGKPVTIKAGTAKFAIDQQGNVTIEGLAIKLKAQTNIEFEAGANATMKGNAETTVQGAIVSVKAQTMASLESSGMTAVKGSVVKVN